jgi:iron complex outermembrane receptor protein
MKNMGFLTLADALRTMKGMYVLPSERHLQKIYIRGIGTDSSYNDKILLLIDGTPQRELVYGHAFIDEYLPIENIEKVEIIRGPGSALYGTNAFAGVINVITKKDLEDTKVFADYGTKETMVFGFNFGRKKESQKLVIFARNLDTKGSGQEYSNRHKKNTLVEDPAKSSCLWLDYSMEGFFLGAKYIEFHHKMPTNWDFLEQTWEANWFDYRNYFVDLKYEHPFSDETSLLVKTWWQYYDNSSFWQLYDIWPDSYTIKSDIWPYKKSQFAGLETRFRTKLADDQDVTLGGEYDYEQIKHVEDVEYKRAIGKIVDPPRYLIPAMEKNNFALYLQDIWKPIKTLQVTLGARNDFHQVYGSYFSPRGAVIFLPFEELTIKFLYGQAFRAPSYRELYTETTEETKGNKDLKPEIITTPEIEIDLALIWNLKLALNAYQSEVKDSIVINSLPGYQYGIYGNSDNRLEFKGWESSLDFAFSNFNAFLGYSYNEAKDKVTGEERHSIPKHMANMGLNYRLKDVLNLNLTTSWVGKKKRWPDDKNSYDSTYTIGQKRPDIPQYTTVNFTISSKIKNWDASLSVFNVLDEKQFDPYIPKGSKYCDIKKPGRNVLFRISYNF